MIDLFRFISLRPPAIPGPTQTVPIEPSQDLVRRLGHLSGPAQGVVTKARELLAAGAGVVTSTAELAYGGSYANFVTAASSADDSGAPAGLAQLIAQNFGQNAATLVASPGFTKDKAAVSDTLILVKLASTGAGVDVSGLNTALQAIAVVENVADGVAAPSLTPVFVLSDLPLASPAAPPVKGQPLAAPEPKQPPAAAQPTTAQDLATAIRNLTNVPASLLQPVDVALALPGRSSARAIPPAKAPADPPGKAKQASPPTTSTGQVLAIPPAVARTLDPAVARAAARLNLDVSRMSVPQLVNAMSSALARAAGPLTAAGGQPVVVNIPGQVPGQTGLGGDPGTGPLPTLPTQAAGIVAPVGIGDLLVVKQRPLRYEGGDVAHIENILRSEAFTRDTKRIDLTETTVSTETDMTTEQEQDTQSTDRFALQRETANTITQDASLKAGVSVSASYGPTVSVKANLDSATNSSQQDSTKVSTSYSQDVTSRAASSITQTTKQIQTMLTSNSFEEDISHGFDNTSGPDNISGVYQWVNKVYQAQVYNYGQRLMFDVMVPEPAAFLIAAMATQPATTPLPPNPPPITFEPGEISESPLDSTFYQALAKPYGTTDLDPPPDLYVTIAAEAGQDSLDSSKPSAKQGELKVPDGYQAYTVTIGSLLSGTNAGGQSLFGNLDVTVGAVHSVANGPHAMNDEIGSVPYTLIASETDAYTVGIEVTCQRTGRAFQVWQEKVHASIMQDYQKLLDAYNNAVSNAAANASPVQGHNPLLNSELQEQELKKACISLVTGQEYEAFGAIELSNPEGYPEVLLANVSAQSKYVRFLEEAFEWDQMTYFYYPYYWGRKGRWTQHVLVSDPDPQFSDFLDAGYARVVFPVRLNYEYEVLHLLETGLVYDGGDVPKINSPQYVSIITELQEQEGAPGTETAQGDPWEVTLPTTLVKLRKDDQLPQWHWDNSVPPQWVEVNPE